MELTSIIDLFQSVPFFVWIILIFIILALFSDKQLWEYEAKFIFQEGIGGGELEIEYYKKAKGSVDLELTLDELFQNKPLEVFLEDDLILAIPAEQNTGPRLHFHDEFKLAEPHEGMKVHIKCDNEPLFTAQLLLD